MRQLHVVALSEDGKSVLLATSKTAKAGTFSLPLDAKLAKALRGDLPRPGEREVRDIGVSPKEIQARLRAGESPQQIADSAGVPVARVDRFAGPVLSERERIIEEARAAFVTRNRRGLSQLPLGDAVDAALAETSGLRADSVTWTARRLESGHWLVQVSFVARARTRTASWVYEPHVRSVTASDSASAALGHVGEEPGPRRSAPAAAPRRAASTRPRARKAARAARPKPVAKKAAPVAKKAVVKKSAPAARKAATKPVAKRSAPVANKAVPKKTAPVTTKARAAARTAAPAPTRVAKAAPPATAAKKPATRSTPQRTLRRSAAAEELGATPVVKWGPPVEPAGPPNLRVVPAPEPDPVAPPEPEPVVEAAAEPAAAVPTSKRRAAGERAHVPDWADVLLGATPKRTDD